MSGSLVLNGEQTFLDVNGDPLASGQVFFYTPGTTNARTTWSDENLTIVNTNPVVLDQAGRAIIWGDGLYRQVVQDQFGNLVWDQTTVAGFSTGTITLSGLTVNGTTVLNGNTTINGTLSVSGETTLGALSVLGNESVGGNFSVAGTTSLAGLATLGNGLTVTGPINFIDAGSGTTIFSTSNGVPTFTAIPGQDGLIVTGGGTDLRGGLNVEGDAGFAGALTVQGNLGVAGVCTFSNVTNFGQTATFDDDVVVQHNVIPFSDNTGTVGFGGRAWSSMSSYDFNTVSDERLKRDIRSLDVNCIEVVRKTSAHRYRIGEGDREQWGLMAQDLSDATDGSIGTDGQVSLYPLLTVLWKALQDVDHRLMSIQEAVRHHGAHLAHLNRRRDEG